MLADDVDREQKLLLVDKRARRDSAVWFLRQLKKVFLTRQCAYQPFIFVPGRRVPRARLQSPRHCVPAGLSARAFPAGVAAFHYNFVTVY